MGPLTNAALCSKLDPHFIQNVKHIYIMGGSMEAIGNTTRFHIFCKISATFIFRIVKILKFLFKS